jgi:hypothetical protein
MFENYVRLNISLQDLERVLSFRILRHNQILYQVFMLQIYVGLYTGFLFL